MTLTYDNPRFPEYLERLTGPEGIDLQEDGTCSCAGPTDTSKSVAILRAMGLNDDAIASTLAYFAARGGFSDRDIVLHAGVTRGDQDALDYSDERPSTP
jgi:hypothetical protein